MFTAFQHQAELLHGRSHGCSGQAPRRTCSPDMDRCRCAAAVEIECWTLQRSKMIHACLPLLRRTRWAAVPAAIAEYCRRTGYTASLSTVYSLLAAVGGHEEISLDCRWRGQVGDWLGRPRGGRAACLLHARIAPPDTSTVHHCPDAMLLPCNS